VAAHLEHVDEVGGEGEREREIVVLVNERLDGHPVIELLP